MRRRLPLPLLLLLCAAGPAAFAGMPVVAPGGRFAPVPGWAGAVGGIAPFVASQSQLDPSLTPLNGVLGNVTARLAIDPTAGLASMEFVRFMPKKYQADPAAFSAQPETRQAAALLKGVKAAGRSLDQEASGLAAKLAAGTASSAEAERLTAIRENSFYLSDAVRRGVDEAFAVSGGSVRALDNAKRLSADEPIRQGAAYDGAHRRDAVGPSTVSAEDSRGGIVTTGPVKIKNAVVALPNGAKLSVRPGVAEDVSKVTTLIHDAFSIWKERGLDLGPMHQTDEQTAAHFVSDGYVAVDSKGALAGTFSLEEGAVRPAGKTKLRFTEGGKTVEYSRLAGAKGALPSGPLLVFKKAAVKRGAANSGLGTELYALAEAAARENGYAGMILETVKEAGWLYDWYVRIGFKQIGSLRYPNRSIDTVLMIKPFRGRK
jgi:hypothetical protein